MQMWKGMAFPCMLMSALMGMCSCWMPWWYLPAALSSCMFQVVVFFQIHGDGYLTSLQRLTEQFLFGLNVVLDVVVVVVGGAGPCQSCCCQDAIPLLPVGKNITCGRCCGFCWHWMELATKSLPRKMRLMYCDCCLLSSPWCWSFGWWGRVTVILRL